MVVRAVEVLTSGRVARFCTHDFLTFALSRHGKADAGYLRIRAPGPGSLLVSPREDALSHDVRASCAEQLLRMPDTALADGGVRFDFATDGDAHLFLKRW